MMLLRLTCKFIHYQAQRHGLTSWMEEMDVFLHAEDPTKGDLPTLQAQLDESSVSSVIVDTVHETLCKSVHCSLNFDLTWSRSGQWW